MDQAGVKSKDVPGKCHGCGNSRSLDSFDVMLFSLLCVCNPRWGNAKWRKNWTNSSSQNVQTAVTTTGEAAVVHRLCENQERCRLRSRLRSVQSDSTFERLSTGMTILILP